MSFELFVQFFVDGQPSSVRRDALRALFPVVDGESEPNHWEVRYDERNWCSIDVKAAPGKKGRIEAFAIVRPCTDSRLWRAIVDAMRMGNGVMLFPGNPGAIVATADAAKELPSELVKGMGPVRVARTGRDVKRFVWSS